MHHLARRPIRLSNRVPKRKRVFRRTNGNSNNNDDDAADGDDDGFEDVESDEDDSFTGPGGGGSGDDEGDDDEVRPTLTIGAYCYRGRHRSVAFVEELARRDWPAGWSVRIDHRDINSSGGEKKTRKNARLAKLAQADAI